MSAGAGRSRTKDHEQTASERSADLDADAPMLCGTLMAFAGCRRSEPDNPAVAVTKTEKEAKDPEPVMVLAGHKDSVNAMAFSPDGKILASGTSTRGVNTTPSFKLWDLATGKEKADLNPHYPILRIAFSPTATALGNGTFACATEGGVRTPPARNCTPSKSTNSSSCPESPNALVVGGVSRPQRVRGGLPGLQGAQLRRPGVLEATEN
jgi:WD40 repeat protein